VEMTRVTGVRRVTSEALAGLFLQHSKELTASTIVHDEVQLVSGLKGPVESDYEGVISGG
jgi:hypothetical protein